MQIALSVMIQVHRRTGCIVHELTSYIASMHLGSITLSLRLLQKNIIFKDFFPCLFLIVLILISLSLLFLQILLTFKYLFRLGKNFLTFYHLNLLKYRVELFLAIYIILIKIWSNFLQTIIFLLIFFVVSIIHVGHIHFFWFFFIHKNISLNIFYTILVEVNLDFELLAQITQKIYLIDVRI